jgi:hypothetical protein
VFVSAPRCGGPDELVLDHAGRTVPGSR